MQFSQKLTSLMNTVGVNNKTLAAAIHVDPSLISRWRKGERLPTKNSSYLQQISSYFSQCAGQKHHQVALLALMNLPLDSAADRQGKLEQQLYVWLSQEGEVEENPLLMAENFLLHTEAVSPEAREQMPTSYSDLPQGRLQTAEIFYGEQGMRDASLKLLALSLASGKPQTISFFSDQSLDWLNGNPEYDRLWCQLIFQCLEKGDRIQVVHDVMRNSYELFTILKRWLPLYMTGQVKSYYCPRHLGTIYTQAFNAIPGVAAITSSCYTGAEYEAEVRLHTDSKGVESVQRTLNHILQNSYPMIQVYGAEEYQELQNAHLEFSKKLCDNISMVNMLTAFSMPEDLFREILGRLEIPAADQDAAYKQFRLKQSIFHESLQTYRYTELINLPEPRQLRLETLPVNMAIFFGHNNAYYADLAEFKAHIANVIYLMETFDNYLCILQEDSPFQNLQIQAREDVGVLFTKESGSLFSFYLSQPSMVQVFYNYLESTVSNFPKQQKNRALTIAKLQEYLQL